MDRASQVLADGLPNDQPRTYAALSEWGQVPYTTLYHRARGRPSKRDKAISQQYLSPSEEKALVKYILRMRDLGFPVRVKYLPSLAFIIARQRSMTDKTIKPPGKNWPKPSSGATRSSSQKNLDAIDWNRHDSNIYDKIVEWFEKIEKVLEDPAILPENVYNMDEIGVMLSLLGSIKVLVGKDDWQNHRGAGVKRTMVTAIECISADGTALLPMIIWPATTHRENWTAYPTPGWHYARSESGYTDSKISLDWLKRVFDPQTKALAQDKPRILISDGFGTHETLEIIEYCFENNIILCRIPSHTSHKLQPCDVGVFSPLKTAYREQVEQVYRGGASAVRKEHFISLYGPARNQAITSRNIKAGWMKAGLFPFDPDRVLKDIQKPLTQLTVPNAEITKVDSSPQNEIVQTPVTAEALTWLRGRIEG
jgi:hypothetical protein